MAKQKYSFDSKIHIYRATKRMSQQELADLVGVSRQTIIQLERNRYNPSMLLAYSIAKVFDVAIEDFNSGKLDFHNLRDSFSTITGFHSEKVPCKICSRASPTSQR